METKITTQELADYFYSYSYFGNQYANAKVFDLFDLAGKSELLKEYNGGVQAELERYQYDDLDDIKQSEELCLQRAEKLLESIKGLK